MKQLIQLVTLASPVVDASVLNINCTIVTISITIMADMILLVNFFPAFEFASASLEAVALKKSIIPKIINIIGVAIFNKVTALEVIVASAIGNFIEFPQTVEGILYEDRKSVV